MISKILLNPNDDLCSCIVEYSDEKQDYIIDVPNGITREELVELVEEIKRITEYAV